MNGRFRIHDSAVTHVGKVRTGNEDSYALAPAHGVWLVADGMGGHAHGKFASQAVVDAVNDALSWVGPDRPWQTIADGIHDANRRVFAISQQRGEQMGSTVVAMVLDGAEFVVLWAGDSRAYLLRDGLLIRLTRDHTMVESMIERGLLTPEGAADHPMKHVLARAVGVQEELELDAVRDEVRLRDVFMLCSDGLYGVVEEDEIARILSEAGAEAGERLVDAALAAGGPDNVTVALITVSEPTLLAVGGNGLGNGQ